MQAVFCLDFVHLAQRRIRLKPEWKLFPFKICFQNVKKSDYIFPPNYLSTCLSNHIWWKLTDVGTTKAKQIKGLTVNFTQIMVSLSMFSFIYLTFMGRLLGQSGIQLNGHVSSIDGSKTRLRRKVWTFCSVLGLYL